ncbi:zinc finger protein 782-like [Actinia tenebrosa]|uniref:Zinc finger protein 782-like n=1 Tax=Actinia tenebrosa TaxID=6105 RepID=A0A6P8J3I5_ACTTE|nr:zinc finger protein 782-like [Actinia tenebrosa]
MGCPECNKEFSSKQRLRNHAKRGVCAPIVCDDCDKEFSSKQRLRYHVDNAVCRRTNKCEDCGKVLSSHQRLLSYEKTHEVVFQRVAKSYDLEGVDCYECGDIMSRCKHNDEYIKDRIRYKRKMHKTFPFFDLVEGVPWTNREYWRQECDRCGHVREEEHITNGCLTH